MNSQILAKTTQAETLKEQVVAYCDALFLAGPALFPSGSRKEGVELEFAPRPWKDTDDRVEVYTVLQLTEATTFSILMKALPLSDRHVKLHLERASRPRLAG